MWSILLTAKVERIGVVSLLFTKLKDPERFIISVDLFCIILIELGLY